MAAKGWFNKVFGARKDDERAASPSAATPSSSKPKPKSGASTPRGSASPSASHSRSESRATGNPPAGTNASANANAPPMSEFMASAMAAAESGMTWENQGSGARTPRRSERVIDETTALSSLTDQEIARLSEGIQADVLKQVSCSNTIGM